MASFREIKREARAKVHDTLKVPALYLAPLPGGGPVIVYDDPVEVTVRIHYVFYNLGQLPGDSFNASERREINPYAILLVEEVPSPLRNAVISVESGEAYRVDHVYPKDDLTVKVDILKLSASEAVGLPVPE